MQRNFFNKILDGVKKENGKSEVNTSNLTNKKEEIMESVRESKNSKSQTLDEENNVVNKKQEKSKSEATENEKEKLSQKTKNNAKKAKDENPEELNKMLSTQPEPKYVIPVIKESQRIIQSDTDVFFSYFSKKRREIMEKVRKGKMKTKKQGPEQKADNIIKQELDLNSKRFILRQSKLIKKDVQAVIFNEGTKGNSGKEKQESLNKEIKSKSQKDVLKKSGQRVDRDSTLFVISTLRRLVDEERFVNAEAETESIFSIPGRKSSKIKTPLTRSRVTDLKNRKTGTRHPKPDKRIILHQLDDEDYNLNKKVEKAEEIYKTYHNHEVWE